MNPADPRPADELVQHAAFLRRLARRLVRDAAEADDLVQDTLVRALEQRPRGRARLRAWLATVLTNRARNVARERGRRRAREAAVARPEALPSHAEATARLDEQRRLLAAVQALPEPYKRTLFARFLEERPSAAIARAEGVPLATVRTRVRRGLELVRADLAARDGDERGAWVVALLPLVSPPVGGRSLAASLVPGALVVKKLCVALALVLVVLAAWRVLPGRSASTEPLAHPQAGAAASAHSEAPAEAPAETARSARSQGVAVTPPSELQPGTLLVTVLGPAGGGLADVGVLVEASGGGAQPWLAPEVRTGADGSARFDALAAGRYRITCDRGVRADVQLPHGQGAEVLLRVEAGQTVTGLVVDAAGEPVAGAAVVVALEPGEDRVDWSAERVAALADERGRFTLAAVDPGAGVFARSPAHVASALWPVADLELLDGVRQARLVLAAPGFGWSGIVLDPAGVPVEGAVVVAGQRYRAGVMTPSGVVRCRSLWQVARTGADGGFEVVSESADILPLSVVAPDLAPWCRLLRSTDRGAPLVVRLELPARLRGTVTAPPGWDLAQSEVALSMLGGQTPEETWQGHIDLPPVLVDEEGHFEVEGLPALQLALQVDLATRAEALRAERIVELHAGELTTVELELQPLPCLAVRVERVDGEPLVGWRVRFSGPDDPGYRELETDAHGGVRAEGAQGLQTVEVLPPAPWSAPVLRLEGIAPEGDRTIVVDPVPLGASLSGRVDDAPDVLRGAALEVVVEHLGTNEESTTRVVDGRFRLTELPPGPVRIRLRAGGRRVGPTRRALLHAGDELDLGTLTLQSPGSVRVRVSGAVPPDEELRALLFDEGEYPAFHLGRTADGLVAEAVAPGRYVLVVDGEGVAAPLTEVVVTPGGEHELAVELAPARLVVVSVPDAPELLGRDLVLRLHDEAGRLVLERHFPNWQGGDAGRHARLAPGPLDATLVIEDVGLRRCRVRVPEEGDRFERLVLPFQR